MKLGKGSLELTLFKMAPLSEQFTVSPLLKIHTVNREIFVKLKVGEFAFFQLAVDKIPCLLQTFNA
jgi:hypothetical protein